MSRWIEKTVTQGLVILACLIAFWAPPALAQAQKDAQDQSANPTGQEAEKPAGAAVERPLISTGLDSDAIARIWPDSSIWLEPPEEEPVLALFEPESETPAKGALVILADEGQSPASGLAAALRQPMARAGWAVMVVGLETPPYELQEARRQRDFGSPEDAGMPETDAADETSEKSVDDESVMIDVMASEDVEALASQYRARIQKALAAAVGNLVGRGYSRVAMAGVGRAAGHVTHAATASGGQDVSALVWIAPVFDQSDSKALAESLGESGALKVLELYSARSSLDAGGATQRSPKQREAAFRRAGIAGYSRQPVAMAEQPQPREAQALTNRVSAWLASER
ncbi:MULTISPECIES: DUF3530 family protein [Marinobacter]|uniref:DUF3530 family protein n=6 Tax=Pseudomonadota TaxID=1224 RepID=UPI000C960508|nr:MULTISPECIES: DUF3530 family protein [Marinobacter]MAB54020.1 hypothetical protein [Marinobacter sp.]MDM8180543.1 DUF3530 family protein [Marinobacter salarius]RUT75987.1 DUF3530 family protein [Marinobacter sp. NP-6]